MDLARLKTRPPALSQAESGRNVSFVGYAGRPPHLLSKRALLFRL